MNTQLRSSRARSFHTGLRCDSDWWWERGKLSLYRRNFLVGLWSFLRNPPTIFLLFWDLILKSYQRFIATSALPAVEECGSRRVSYTGSWRQFAPKSGWWSGLSNFSGLSPDTETFPPYSFKFTSFGYSMKVWIVAGCDDKFSIQFVIFVFEW